MKNWMKNESFYLIKTEQLHLTNHNWNYMWRNKTLWHIYDTAQAQCTLSHKVTWKETMCPLRHYVSYPRIRDIHEIMPPCLPRLLSLIISPPSPPDRRWDYWTAPRPGWQRTSLCGAETTGNTVKVSRTRWSISLTGSWMARRTWASVSHPVGQPGKYQSGKENPLFITEGRVLGIDNPKKS